MLKSISSCGFGNPARQVVMLCMAAAVAASAQAKETSFDAVFDTKGEPAALHYRAVFTANGADHQLEVWRDGDKRVKRITDDAIETYAFHESGNTEFHMSVLDKRKRIHTVIDRTNLYRIGNFTDWFDLGHGLRHPKAGYQLSAANAPAGVPSAIQPCAWYALTQDSRTTQICWSPRDRVPLMIVAQDGKVLWRMTSLDRKPVPAKIFEIHDAGYVRNDANEDIEQD